MFSQEIKLKAIVFSDEEFIALNDMISYILNSTDSSNKIHRVAVAFSDELTLNKI